MCTLSIIPLGKAGSRIGEFRVVMNRDESPSRPAALPPAWHELGGGNGGLWPTDPLGGGTWIGASRRGIVLCVLNRNLEPTPELPSGLASRGTIIPAVLGMDRLEELEGKVRGLRLERFAPFRCVGIAGDGAEISIRSVCWELDRLVVDPPAKVPMCYVSSGLGDSKVGVRLELFDKTLRRRATPQAQREFHHHRWADRPEVSVLMSRRGARTVSITTVEVRSGAHGASRLAEVTMDYEPLGDSHEWSRGAEVSVMPTPRTGVAARSRG
jgi:hypothetical protein